MEHRHIKKLNWAFIAVSFSGFMNALYLSIERLRGIPMTCTLLEGCEKVNSSTYATIVNIPVAYIGVAYYLLIFALGLWFLAKEDHRLVFLASLLTIMGALVSAWFVYLQLFVIKAICVYCMISAITSTLLFIFGMYYLFKYYKKVGQHK